MKIDNSNKRYSTIIAGILAIFAISIFLVLFIGCGDNNFYNQDDVQISHSGISLDSEKHHLNRDIGKNKNVPVAKNEKWCRVEAQTGDVDFSLIWFDKDGDGFTYDANDYYFNIDDGTYDMVLPNCIIDDLLVSDGLGVDTDNNGDQDEDQLSDWIMTATVTGGYHPVSWNSYLDIYMKKYTGNEWIETFAGRIYIYWEETSPCSGQYVGHFMVENNAPTSDVIKLESSYAPDGTWMGKKYSVEFYSTWAGCGSPDQEFGYILAQKPCISGVPNSRFHRQLNVIMN